MKYPTTDEELVSYLRGHRDLKRAKGVKVEGRKSHLQARPEVVVLAKELKRYPVDGKVRSLRAVAEALAERGFLNSNGKVYQPASIQSMLRQ